MLKTDRLKIVWKISFTLAAFFFSGLLYALLPKDCPEAARRTAAIFLLAGIFWALEILPLYITSLLAVLLLVFFLALPGGPLGLDTKGYQLFLNPFADPVIMLFMGGLVLAQMMRKYRVDALLASKIIKHVGEKPVFVLLGFMSVTAFLSMWMSNTATTALMLAIIAPLLVHLKSEDVFSRGLVLAIPFGANIGGMGTPIGTPPNAIAIGIIGQHGDHIGFLKWMLIAGPLMIGILIIAGGVLIWMFPSKAKTLALPLEEKIPMGFKAKAVMGVAVCAAALWLSSEWHHIPESIVALLAVAAFAIIGLMDAEDLKQIEWEVLILMWGGLALGKAMEQSHLTQWIIDHFLQEFSGTALIILFCALAAFLTTFMSNTATANLLLPLAMGVPGADKTMLGVMVAMACSLSMVLPISTPPNAMAFATHKISAWDMVKAGILIVALSLVFMFAFMPLAKLYLFRMDFH